MGRDNPTHIFNLFYRVLFGLVVAVPAVNRFITARLKRDFRLFAALGTSGRIHLTGTSIIVTAAITSKTLGSFRRTTRGTALGLIGKALGSEELLLFYRKRESFAAIGTLHGFLCKSH